MDDRALLEMMGEAEPSADEDKDKDEDFVEHTHPASEDEPLVSGELEDEEDLFGDAGDVEPEPEPEPKRKRKREKKTKKKTKKKKGEPEPKRAKQEKEEPRCVFDVQAWTVLSVHPPAQALFLIKKSKTPMAHQYVALRGELVRTVSSPVHVFRVEAWFLAGETTMAGYPVFVLTQILDVVSGPARKGQRMFTKVPTYQPELLLTTLQTKITQSGYYAVGDDPKTTPTTPAERTRRVKQVFYGAKLVSGLLNPADKKTLNAEVLRTQFAPEDEETILSWACRFAGENETFFRRSNLVGGGYQARALEKETALWEALDGVSVSEKEKPVTHALSEDDVVRIFDTLHFAGDVASERTAFMSRILRVSSLSAEAQAKLECINRASRVWHRLPHENKVDPENGNTRNIVYGERGEEWPLDMRKILKSLGLHVAKDSRRQSWFACHRKTAVHAEMAYEAITKMTVLQVETDDDHEGHTNSYLDALRAHVASTPNLIVVANKRARYLRQHVPSPSVKFVTHNNLFEYFTPQRCREQQLSMWVDRAHWINGRLLNRIIHEWGNACKHITLTGSLYANSIGPNVTLFARIASTVKTGVINSDFALYKGAAMLPPYNKQPQPQPQPQQQEQEQEQAERLVNPIIIYKNSPSEIGPHIKEAFPDSRSTSLKEIAHTEESFGHRLGMLCIYNDRWNISDVSTALQRMVPGHAERVVFAGPTSHKWKEALTRNGPAAQIPPLNAFLMPKHTAPEGTVHFDD
jgi:hypothetical protein